MDYLCISLSSFLIFFTFLLIVVLLIALKELLIFSFKLIVFHAELALLFSYKEEKNHNKFNNKKNIK